MAINDIVHKLHLRTLGLDIHILDSIAEGIPGNSPVSIARIMGNITGAKAGVGEYGPYHKYTGDFLGINLVNGEQVRAPSLLLPPVADEPLAAQWEDAANEGSQSMQFGFELTIIPNRSSRAEQGGRKYIFGVKKILDSGNDPLAKLAASIEESHPVRLLTNQPAQEEEPAKGSKKK